MSDRCRTCHRYLRAHGLCPRCQPALYREWSRAPQWWSSEDRGREPMFEITLQEAGQ